MKGLFWNCRGIGGNSKRKFIREFGHKLDFVGIQFIWNWVPAAGRSGGILFGVRESEFDVVAVEKGVYILKVEVFHKPSQMMWSFLVVYGDAQPDGK